MRKSIAAATVVILLLAASGVPAEPKERIIANQVFTVADDFVVDVYHNGKKVPDEKRKLVQEVYGATAERIDIQVQQGDWLVFNVVNNRLRWGGASYFGVTGRSDDGIAFVTNPDDDRWSFCDDTDKVSEFIEDRDYRSMNRAKSIETPWGEGDRIMNSLADGWKGKPIWGQTRNTWIKFVAR